VRTFRGQRFALAPEELDRRVDRHLISPVIIAQPLYDAHLLRRLRFASVNRLVDPILPFGSESSKPPNGLTGPHVIVGSFHRIASAAPLR
jgi:hypothetical protein